LSRKSKLCRKITAATILFLTASSSLFVSAQDDPATRDSNIQKTMDDMEAEIKLIPTAGQNSLSDAQSASNPGVSSAPGYTGQSSREQSMEITLRDIAIEISLEYFINMGQQTFDVIDETGGNKISSLTFPLRGGMPVVKGEVRFLPRVSLGGKYADSALKEKTCTDEDWDFWAMHNSSLKYIDYQITRQAGKSRVEFYDLNLYYNLFNFSDDAQGQRRLFPATERPERDFGLDGASFDVFIGYEYYKSRCQMLDPLYEYERFVEGSWWYMTGLPADYGLDSFYKIEYQGPRIGFRAAATKGKCTTGLRCALASLRSKAHGWWNLREYSYWQTGKNGLGAEAGLDVTYAVTRSFSAGVGFNYLGYFQDKMKESGNYPGYSYDNADIIRNANSRNYGPTFILKYIW
jgi:hypothetical protein